MSQVVRVSALGRQWEFQPGHTVSLGRRPDSDVVLSNPRASGRHGVLQHDGTSWVYADQGSSNGTWIGGRQLTGPERITTGVTLWLGAVDDHDEVTVMVVAAQHESRPAPTDPTTPRFPPTKPAVAVPPPDLVVETAGTTRSFPPGTVVLLGRRPESTIVLTNPASSGRHAEVRFEGGSWVFRDVGSSNGSWVGGSRVTAATVQGRLVVRLGKPEDGADVLLSTGAAGGLGDETVINTGGAIGAEHSLLATAGGRTAVMAADRSRAYRVGRDPAADLEVTSEHASRSHLRLDWTGGGWTATDTSSGGTYLPGGKRVPSGTPIPVKVETKLLLGDPTRGELLTLTPADASPATAGVWWQKPWVWASGAAVVVVALVGGVLLNNPGPSSAPGTGGQTGTSFDLDTIKRSVVRLDMFDTQGTFMGGGSGTIISADGLILTNAHVAAPTAPGQSAQYGFGGGAGPAVDHLVVGLTTDPAQPAVDTYRAELLVADGYVDLAVVKITAKADGSPLDGTLDLPTLPLAPDGEIQPGDDLTVLGFPGASESKYITVTQGNMSAFVPDPRMDSDRAFFESTAKIRHGNSGGTAIDDQGRLVGVPTRLAGSGVDLSERVRPAEFARPLIEIAEQGGDPNYFSPYLQPVDEAATITDWGVTTDNVDTCTGILQSEQAEQFKFVLAAVQLSAKDGVDQFAAIHAVTADGKLGQLVAGGESSFTSGSCAYVAYDFLETGSYAVAGYVGPNNDRLVGWYPFTVGTDSQEDPGAGGQEQTNPGTNNAACTPGNPISSWVLQQSVQLGAVNRSSDQKEVIEGGKILVVRIIGEQGGYATAPEANQAAMGAMNTELATVGPYSGVMYQRWMVVLWGGRYYAVLGQHRPLVVMGQNAAGQQVPMPNPADDDWCYSPDEEYKIEQWHALFYESLIAWWHYDSASNTLTVYQ